MTGLSLDGFGFGIRRSVGALRAAIETEWARKEGYIPDNTPNIWVQRLVDNNNLFVKNRTPDLSDSDYARLFSTMPQVGPSVYNTYLDIAHCSVLAQRDINAEGITFTSEEQNIKFQNSGAYYSPTTNHIALAPSFSCNPNERQDMILHELGHSVHFVRQPDGSNKPYKLDELATVFKEEVSKYNRLENAEELYATVSPEEMFAEVYAMLNGASAPHYQQLRKHFPRCVETIERQLAEIRALPQTTRAHSTGSLEIGYDGLGTMNKYVLTSNDGVIREAVFDRESQTLVSNKGLDLFTRNSVLSHKVTISDGSQFIIGSSAGKIGRFETYSMEVEGKTCTCVVASDSESGKQETFVFSDAGKFVGYSQLFAGESGYSVFLGDNGTWSYEKLDKDGNVVEQREATKEEIDNAKSRELNVRNKTN